MRNIIKLVLFAIIMLLFGAVAYGQNASPVLGSGTALQINYNKGGGADDSMTAIPVRRSYVRAGDTLYKNYRLKGRIRIDYDSLRFYYHDGTGDVRVLDTKDTANLLATKAYVVAGIGDKVKYIDTAAMLSPYVRQSRTVGTTSPLSGGGDLSANRALSLDTTNWHSYNFYKTQFHRQGGNSYGTGMTQGTLDANSWSVFTNGSGNTRYNISSAGAHAFTGTTFDFTPTTGSVGISNAGQLTITRGGSSENSLSVGLSGTTARVIMGIGNGTIASIGRPYINFSLTGNPDNTSPTITTNSGSLLFSNIGGAGQVNFVSNNFNVLTPVFTVQTAQTPVIRWSPIQLFSGGGITATQDFFNIYYTSNDNANITYTSGTNTFRTCIATPRINTSGTHIGNIEGFVYEPAIVAIASGTTQVAFRANNASGYGVFVGNSAVKNHFNGHVLIGTTTDDTKAILNVTSTIAYALLPRMTTTQRDAITSPAEGAEIYNLTTHKKQVFDGTAWQDCW